MIVNPWDIRVGDIVKYYENYAVVSKEVKACVLLTVNKYGHEIMCLKLDPELILISDMFRVPHGTPPHPNIW